MKVTFMVTGLNCNFFIIFSVKLNIALQHSITSSRYYWISISADGAQTHIPAM